MRGLQSYAGLAQIAALAVCSWNADAASPTAQQQKEDPRIYIAINEIMFNSSVDIDSPDWVEIFNYSCKTTSIEYWTLKDNNDAHAFMFPEHSVLKPYQYLVVAKDAAAFRKCYGPGFEVTGDMNFGLGQKDAVRLYDDRGEPVDSVAYMDKFPWYPGADGKGGTIELVNPCLATANPSSWAESLISGGTPGRKNSVFKKVPGARIMMEPVGPLRIVPSTKCLFALKAFSPNGGRISYAANNLPINAVFNGASGEFAWTPDRTQVGRTTLDISAVDEDGYELASQVVLDVADTVLPSRHFMFLFGSVIDDNGDPAPIGAVIRVENGDSNCYGTFTVQAEGKYGAVAVYGDEPATEEKEGFGDGEVMRFRVNHASAVPADERELRWRDTKSARRADLRTASP